MQFKTEYLIGMTIGMGIFALDFLLFFKTRWFWPVLVLALTVSWFQFWIDYFAEIRRQKEIELQFLEYIRNVSESVKSGISIPMSIKHVSKKDFGALTPYIKKLSNQIEWGIPTSKALKTFALDTNNSVISRSVSIIIEAEQSGGNISDIFDSVVDSVVNVKKMKEERKASVYSQIVQGYVVFYLFIGIMLVLQLWLFPKLTSLGGGFKLGSMSPAASAKSFNLDRIFFYMAIIQGFFAGIMIGKFSEGTIKNGLLHSLILITSSALLITTIKGTL